MTGAADPELRAPPRQPEQGDKPPSGNAGAIIALTKPAPPVEEPPPPKVAACEAEVGDPQLLFGSSILLRPPKGVEFMPDDGNPTFAQAVMSGGFISACDATVKRMFVLAFAHDPSKSVDQYAGEFVETLADQGYVDGTLRAETLEHGEYQTAIDFPADGGNPASTLHIAAVHRKGATVSPIENIDSVFVLVYETTADEYDLLEPTFRQSGRSLFIIPPE